VIRKNIERRNLLKSQVTFKQPSQPHESFVGWITWRFIWVKERETDGWISRKSSLDKW